jgi:predicted nucleic acid-binding protein
VFGADAVTLPDAWRKYDLFLSDPRVTFAEEPAGTEVHWRTYTQTRSFSTHVWNDAYLAAFSLAGGLKLVTFDRGLARYRNVPSTILA